MRKTIKPFTCFTVAVLLIASSACGDVTTQLETIKSVGAKGSNHEAAVAAVNELAKATPDSILTIFTAIEDKNRLADNWLRGAVASIVDRHLAAGAKLPVDAIADYISDTNHSPASRFVAFQTLKSLDEQRAAKLVPKMANDPSLDLRRLAVANLIEQAKVAEHETKAYQAALESARDIDQIEQIAEKLDSLGQKPDLVKHFGFLVNWHIIGPFDNTGSKSFDVAYPPEENFETDLLATYEGQTDNVTWQKVSTDDKLGTINLNDELGNHKGAIAYAYAEFDSAEDVSAELRLGCINANKVWLNGELLTANEVYHSGTVIDQYVGRGDLKKGKNRILLKIAQNEQTESWAQRWQFQLRVCDGLGTAILQQ